MTADHSSQQLGAGDLTRGEGPENTADGSHRAGFIWALILVGAILRIGYFWLDTRFWGDEAALALNLKTRTLSQFLGPLEYDQHAPLFYVLLEKGLFDALGPGEHGLRLPSLVASLVSLPLFFWWMRLTAPTRVSLIGLIFFALNPRLISYSAQMKPYTIDVLSTLLVCLCGLGLRQHGFRGKWLALFALVGGILIWVSFPVVFVLAGVAGTLMAAEWAHGRRRTSALLLLPVLFWGISFVCNQLLITHHSLGNQRLLAYWQDENAFASLPPRSPGDVRALIDLFLRPFADPLRDSSKVLIGIPAIFWLVGLVRLFRRDLISAGFCTLPVVLTFLVSGRHLYPFDGRLILFLVPLFLNPLAWGIASLRTDSTDRVTVPVATAFLLLSYVVLMNDVGHHEFNRTSVPDALNRIAETHQPDDALYAFYSGGYRTFLWYSQSYRLGDMSIIQGSRRTPEKSILEADLGRMKKAGRLWLLFPELHERRFNERDEILRALDGLGRRLDEFHHKDTYVFLYDLSPAANK
jgi:4-amino-4-deoxy-L-arabinose transferase-like glycosyltransferase